jgi:hypothetical protein
VAAGRAVSGCDFSVSLVFAVSIRQPMANLTEFAGFRKAIFARGGFCCDKTTCFETNNQAPIRKIRNTLGDEPGLAAALRRRRVTIGDPAMLEEEQTR